MSPQRSEDRVAPAGSARAPKHPSPLRDAFSGLAPARATSCPRCGTPTVAFANGRGRLDICQPCGTAEATTAEGLELFRMRDLTLTR